MVAPKMVSVNASVASVTSELRSTPSLKDGQRIGLRLFSLGMLLKSWQRQIIWGHFAFDANESATL